jgi:hypothetical protein
MNNQPPISEGGLSTGWQNWFIQAWEALTGWKKTWNKTLTHDFATLIAEATDSATLTIKGARQGDGVQVTPYEATAGVVYYGVVTANDTVTIYAQNCKSVSVNPASTTFRVIVFQN